MMKHANQRCWVKVLNRIDHLRRVGGLAERRFCIECKRWEPNHDETCVYYTGSSKVSKSDNDGRDIG